MYWYSRVPTRLFFLVNFQQATGDLSSETNGAADYLARSRTLRYRDESCKIHAGTVGVKAAMAFVVEGKKGKRREGLWGTAACAIDGQKFSVRVEGEGPADTHSKAFVSFRNTVQSTVGAAKFAKPSLLMDEDKIAEGQAGQQAFYSLKQMRAAQGKHLWRSHVRQKQRILKRLLEDEPQKEHIVKSWLDHNGNVSQCIWHTFCCALARRHAACIWTPA